MAQAGTAQNNDFYKRLARIKAGHAYLADGLVDREMIEYARAGTAGRAEIRKQVKARSKVSAWSVLIPFLLGLSAILGGRVAAFQVNAATHSAFDLPAKYVSALGPYGLAALLLFVVMVGFGLRDKPHVVGIAAGVIIALFGEPYAANQAPALWSQMYSVDHVDDLLIGAGLREPIIVDGAAIAGDTRNLPKVTSPTYKYSGGGSAPTSVAALPAIELPDTK